MSTLLVCAVIAVALVAIVVWVVKPRRASRLVADAIGRDRTHDAPPPPAAPDNVPGTDVFALDDCLRILHATNQLDAGCDRLWDAIRHEQQKGETT